MDFGGERLERLTGMLKRRGIILPAFEIHGGAKGLYDFGPVGGRLRSRLIQYWINHWQTLGNIVEISCPTVTPYEVLEASGHVGEFSDYMTLCLACNEPSRADTLLESLIHNPDALSKNELQSALDEHHPECPICGSIDWSEVKAENLMFETTIGAGASGRPGFLRPETAQGMFTSFPVLYRHFRERLPFGAIQVGKGYRNEISPRQGMIRLREFNMAELEYFLDPEAEILHDFSHWSDVQFTLISEDKGTIQTTLQEANALKIIRHPTVAYFIGHTYSFLTSVGIHPDFIRFRQHESTEMAHYAQDCWDAEICGSYGWIECVGIAHRGCYDLEAHERATGKQLRARREFSEPKIIEIDGWTINGATAGPAFKSYAGEIKSYLEGLTKDTQFPHDMIAQDGTIHSIQSEHVKAQQLSKKETGEGFIPHVVEPAFGIDRIIWHALDHAYQEEQQGEDMYTRLALSPVIAPIDVAVFPLFEKDGMDTLAMQIHTSLCAQFGTFAIFDGSGSIGRRYARADEIGVPECLTIDHQSLLDGTITVRSRDTGQQVRISMNDYLQQRG